MAKLAVFFGLLLTVFYATAEDNFPPDWAEKITVDELQRVKVDIEREIKQNNLTCENYEETYCLKNGGDKICKLWLGGYLCEKLQSPEGVRQILKNIDAYIEKKKKDAQDRVKEAFEKIKPTLLNSFKNIRGNSFSMLG